MNQTHHPAQPPDLSEFARNRGQIPAEELAQYAGCYIAFSADGKQILASAGTEEELEERLRAAGIDPSQVVGSYVPPSGVAILL